MYETACGNCYLMSNDDFSTLVRLGKLTEISKEYTTHSDKQFWHTNTTNKKLGMNECPVKT